MGGAITNPINLGLQSSIWMRTQIAPAARTTAAKQAIRYKTFPKRSTMVFANDTLEEENQRHRQVPKALQLWRFALRAHSPQMRGMRANSSRTHVSAETIINHAI